MCTRRVLHCSQRCESSKETPILSLGLHRKTKTIRATAQHRHSRVTEPITLAGTTGSQSPTARLCTKNYYLHPPSSSPLLQDCTVAMREPNHNHNLRLLQLKTNTSFTSQALTPKHQYFTPIQARFPAVMPTRSRCKARTGI